MPCNQHRQQIVSQLHTGDLPHHIPTFHLINFDIIQQQVLLLTEMTE